MTWRPGRTRDVKTDVTRVAMDKPIGRRVRLCDFCAKDWPFHGADYTLIVRDGSRVAHVELDFPGENHHGVTRCGRFYR